jgi:hypothetical protein
VSEKKFAAEKKSEFRRLLTLPKDDGGDENDPSLERLTAESSSAFGKKIEFCRTLFEQTRLFVPERFDEDDDDESSDSSMAL